MNYIQEAEARGYIYQCTDIDALSSTLSSRKVHAYVGFDCTAPSLHVGSLLQIMILRLLQKHGHTPIVLLGGATTRIGDPSDKDEARPMRTPEEIALNKAGIQSVFKKLLICDGSVPNSAIFVDNTEWLSGLKYLDLLDGVARHFTVNKMVAIDKFKQRLANQKPLTLLEFNYVVLQSYDFVELYKRYGCLLQIGGSEQWSNIINGVDLAQHLGVKERLYGCTSPLITTRNGLKMGKTADGAVWLNEDMLSPYEYWQFWRNVDDGDVFKFLKIYTDLMPSEIDNMHFDNINDAKILLANLAVSMCHGEDAAKRAEKTAKEVFLHGKASADLDSVVLPISTLDEPIPFFRLFVLTGLVSSGGEAKKLIKGRGARLNGEIIEDPFFNISKDMAHDGLRLSRGSKKNIMVTFK